MSIYGQLIETGIARGWIRPAIPEKGKTKSDLSRDVCEKQRRDAFRAQGLNADGTKRHRPWTHLTGLTKKQIKERRRLQSLAYMRKKRGQAPVKVPTPQEMLSL